MKILKAISATLTLIGIALVIGAPVWARLQTSELHSMDKQMREFLANPDNISANSELDEEFGKKMLTEMGSVGDVVKQSMRLTYFGTLCTLVGLGGVCLCLNQEIKRNGIPNISVDPNDAVAP